MDKKFVKAFNILVTILVIIAVSLLCGCKNEKEQKCGMCNGSGYFQNETCPACNGSGKSDYDPYEIMDDIYGNN